MRLFRNKIIFLIAVLLGGCSANPFLQGNSVRDTDWNSSFKSNCRLPKYNSIRWVSESNRRYARFTLTNRDKGGCSTDKTARHSAPYWERAELRQVGRLKKNKMHSIDATLRFVEGFGGERETFFQVHSYNKGCKQAYPPIMLKFDNTHTGTAVLTLAALQSSKHHINHRTDIRIDDIIGGWTHLNLKLDTSKDSSVTLSMNGETLLSDIPFWTESCGILHIKFGAYRPGNKSGNGNSIVEFDSINVN